MSLITSLRRLFGIQKRQEEIPHPEDIGDFLAMMGAKRSINEDGSQVFRTPGGEEIEIVEATEPATLVCPKCNYELDIFRSPKPREWRCISCGHRWTE